MPMQMPTVELLVERFGSEVRERGRSRVVARRNDQQSAELANIVNDQCRTVVEAPRGTAMRSIRSGAEVLDVIGEPPAAGHTEMADKLSPAHCHVRFAKGQDQELAAAAKVSQGRADEL